jgi:hypothetical protein
VAKDPKYSGTPPEISKKPRMGEAVKASEHPIWKVGKIDFDGPWCPKGLPKDDFLQIISKLKHFESMTWVEIERAGSHLIGVDRIIADAKRRLAHLKLDDTDSLFSLRLSGTERIWGLRFNGVFSVLWWDPNHQVCPSQKKHT